MGCGSEGRSVNLEQFRSYLTVLARMHWDPRLQARFEPADLVQQTLLEAHARLHTFRGTSEREMAGWLRTSLAHNLADARIKLLGKNGATAREASIIDAALEESSSRLDAWLAAEQSTPSERASKNEQLLRMADALGQLPPDQREAVVLHHLQEVSLGDLAARLQRSEAAVAGLLRRGMKKLREFLREA